MRKRPPWFEKLPALDPHKSYTAADLAALYDVVPNSIRRGLEGAGCLPEMSPLQIETVKGVKTQWVSVWRGKDLVELWEKFIRDQSKKAHEVR